MVKYQQVFLATFKLKTFDIRYKWLRGLLICRNKHLCLSYTQIYPILALQQSNYAYFLKYD